MPLAPTSPVEKKILFTNAVVNAVIKINESNFPLPYFSSSEGPTININKKLLNQCWNPECPNIYARGYSKNNSW